MNLVAQLLLRPDYVAEYAGGRLFATVAQALPLPTALRLGEWGGERMIFWTRRAFQVAVDNLLHAYPNMTRDEAEALATRVYRHFGRAAVEMVLAHRLLRPSTFRDHVVLRNEHYFRDVLAAGKGAIFLTGHLGVWEVFGLLLNHWGAAPASVYRPIKNPLLDRYVRRRRAEFGQRMVERQGAMPTLLRILRRGGYIALLVDQHAKADGTWVPFFGRPASTTPAPALLALRTGAPIVMGYGCRLTGLYKFEAFCDEPIYAKPSGDRAADIVRVTAEITRRIETYVRAHPDQWLWMHRRWKEPPPHVLAAQHAAASPARP